MTIFQFVYGLFREPFYLLLRPVCAKHRHIRCFFILFITENRLSKLLHRGCDIQDVVPDLERDSDFGDNPAERVKIIVVCSCKCRTCHHGSL